MADENIITFDVTNWITVVIMAAIGFVLLGLAMKLVKNWKSGGGATAGS